MLSVQPGGSVSVSSGDTGALTIQFSGDIPQDGTECLVTLKRSTNSQAPIWEKRLAVSEGQVSVRLESADTALPPGTYSWDARLLLGGEVITPARPMPFKILEVVGDV